MIDAADAIGFLNLSTPAKADCDLTGFYNHGYLPATIGMFKHPLQPVIVMKDIDIIEGNLPTGEVLTGSCSVRAKIMTVNQHFLHRLGSCRPVLA